MGKRNKIILKTNDKFSCHWVGFSMSDFPNGFYLIEFKEYQTGKRQIFEIADLSELSDYFTHE
jgi:hypothetical protein